MPAPAETLATVTGSWWTSLVSGLYWFWGWFFGGVSGINTLAGVLAVVLTSIKIAQEINAWRSRDEEQQALRKLWNRMSRRSHPIPLDSEPRE